MKNKIYLMLFSLLAMTQLLHAEDNHGYKLDAPDYKYGKFYTVHSDSMAKDFPVLVFTPESYDAQKNICWPVVYMLHGTTDMPMSEFGVRKMYNPSTRIQELANQFKVIIVAPLVGNCYYMNSPKHPEIKMASFIANELTSFVDKSFKTQKSRSGRVLCGFSMGGYGAVSLLCKYPDVFSLALERAGVLNLATDVEDLQWDDVNENVKFLLGDYFTNPQVYHLNSCFNLINHIRSRNDIALVIEVGKDDLLQKTNFAFHNWLNTLKIPHIYSETEGSHVWNANTLRSLLSNMQYFTNTQF